ncbi:hypothetical protein AT959_12000 [Dechloromonas denitrificans]|uniref:Ribosome association toxin RatA n=2 Tax=Dechloromonas denitrificans TaxID=281362 RepID=A0A133XGN3_9RHOO|nr:hypothetical protein AT959_12000 [Dechloromonas denitrificans]
MLCLAGTAAADGPAAPLADDDVAVDYRAGTYFASLSLRVAVTPAVALEVLTDFEHMAAFMPNLTSSRLVSRSANVYRVIQYGKADFGPFSFPFESERRIELMPDGRILAQALSGSTKSMRSELHYQAAGGGTRIDYKLEVEPERWLPSVLGVNLMRHELAEQFSALAREMLRRQASRQK